MNYSLCCPKGVSEILFSHDDCQSRIDSRNGSDPCTLISARVAYKILIENVDILAFSSNCKPLLTPLSFWKQKIRQFILCWVFERPRGRLSSTVSKLGSQQRRTFKR